MDGSLASFERSVRTGDTTDAAPVDVQKRGLNGSVSTKDTADRHAHVSVRSAPKNARGKVATVLDDDAAQMPWQLSSDESLSTDRSDKAPAHLNYLAAGLGLFLLSHAEHLAEDNELDVDDAYLEKRLSWIPNRSGHKPVEPALPYGRADIVELVLVIKSRSSNRCGRDLQKFCRQLRRTIRAITAADRVSVTVYVDGRVAGQIGD